MCFFLCQAARVLLTYFVYAPLRMLAFRDFRRLLCVCLSLVVRLWRGAHVPLYVPLLVLAFLDLCALHRVWSTFDKRYGAAFRDFQRLLCARLSLCFKHAPRLVLVFLGSCRLLFGKSPLCKQKSSVQDVQQKHGDLPCFLI